jgi:hypothetical protein
LDASDEAELSSVWLAELSPPVMSPPATATGTFALTPFWSASASESAYCSVSALCSSHCA